MIKAIKSLFKKAPKADCPVCHKGFKCSADQGENVKIKHKTYRIVCPTCMKEHAK